jgi:hypothetical protein
MILKKSQFFHIEEISKHVQVEQPLYCWKAIRLWVVIGKINVLFNS